MDIHVRVSDNTYGTVKNKTFRLDKNQIVTVRVKIVIKNKIPKWDGVYPCKIQKMNYIHVGNTVL